MSRVDETLVGYLSTVRAKEIECRYQLVVPILRTWYKCSSRFLILSVQLDNRRVVARMSTPNSNDDHRQIRSPMRKREMARCFELVVTIPFINRSLGVFVHCSLTIALFRH
ncbi:hypothetical protein P5V15_010935 [Pogonomyrmex californicus]